MMNQAFWSYLLISTEVLIPPGLRSCPKSATQGLLYILYCFPVIRDLPNEKRHWPRIMFGFILCDHFFSCTTETPTRIEAKCAAVSFPSWADLNKELMTSKNLILFEPQFLPHKVEIKHWLGNFWFLFTKKSLISINAHKFKAPLLGNGFDLFLDRIKGLSVRNPPTKQSEVTHDSIPGTLLWGNKLSVEIAVKFPAEHMENGSEN